MLRIFTRSNLSERQEFKDILPPTTGAFGLTNKALFTPMALLTTSCTALLSVNLYPSHQALFTSLNVSDIKLSLKVTPMKGFKHL